MDTTAQQFGILSFLRRFFPFQLLIAHLKHNLVSVLVWAFFFLVITDRFGYAFGVPILFYSPEYLGEVSPVSFGLLGFSFGGFMMGFNTYSYIKLGRYYPFLVRVNRPFFKFCKNNSLIPLAFVVTYLINMSFFQIEEEFATLSEVLFFGFSFIGGILLFVILSILYFFPMSKRHAFQPSEDDPQDDTEQPFESVLHKKRGKWYSHILLRYDRTYYYWGRNFKIVKSRSVGHLDAETIENVLARNRINTSLFELLTITTFIVLGLFSDFKLFETPAAMSIVLLVTALLMLFSAFQSWFGKWSYLLIFGIVFLMNFMSTHTPYFTFKNYAYGLNYKAPETPNYTIRQIERSMLSEKQTSESFRNYVTILENWKQQTGEQRPKLIIVNTSGGGSRSALWTLGVLQKADSELNGHLSASIQLITGASGGMIGASYFRELLLRKELGILHDPYSQRYRENIGKDLLNKLSFSASTRDLFFRYQKFEYNQMYYPKDRGYAFEEQLHENTDGFMDHTLGYYAPFEKSGTIPIMIFTPTIINDGRRLLMSSQSLCFLANNRKDAARLSRSYENIDFQSFFKTCNPNDVRFSSVMRSSSTFPFVMPMVTLPSNPEVQLMDAGIRDNYGGKITMEFLHAMKDWIRENTSGVIIVQIRDTKKILDNESYHQVSLIDKLSLPFGNMYKNFPRTQDFDQEELFAIGSQQFTFPVDLVSFNLREDKKERISLSWHLTSQEKLKIENAFNSTSNQHALAQLKRLLNE